MRREGKSVVAWGLGLEGWSDEVRRKGFQGTKETFGGNGYTHIICDDNFTDV